MQSSCRKQLLLMVAVASVAAAAAVEHDAPGGTTAPAVPDPQIKCTCYPCGVGCPQISLPPPPPPSEYWPPPYGLPPPSEYWPLPYGPPPPSPYLYISGTQGSLYPLDYTYSGAAARRSLAVGPVPVLVVSGLFAVLKLWWL